MWPAGASELSTPGHDYIVVGAGSSGCVVASRLAQKTDARVLLIEAGGGAGSPMINMPMGFAAMIGAGAHNWSYRSDAEPALDQRGVALPRGRVLGGCSSINGMVYIRGQRQDFDGWAAQGNAGWDHASVLPLFKKSEDNWRGAGAFHGAGGELHIRPVGTRLAIADRFIEAAQQQGIPANADFNADVQDGVGYFDANIAHGVRQHTARAFLRPALRRPNLQVMKHAVVRRVLLRNGRAVGVQVLHDGQVIDIGASTEVILCAGAYGSPQILERSGVGDPVLLARLGIETMHALPAVGEHLQDHLNTMVSIETRDCRTYYDFVRPRRIALTLADYVLRRRGICANPAAIVGAFVRIEEGAERPDAEIHFAAGASMQHADGKLTPTPGICATICRLRPDSVGSVHITSADANAAPAIRMNYLAHGRDASFQIRALRRLRRIFDAPALRPYIAGETRPGLQVASDAELLDYIRASSDTVHHPVGSCRMGTGVDAVVNPQLQVIGVENLRIADASVFPSTISGNTNASCIMVGEKAAELMVG